MGDDAVEGPAEGQAAAREAANQDVVQALDPGRGPVARYFREIGA